MEKNIHIKDFSINFAGEIKYQLFKQQPNR